MILKHTIERNGVNATVSIMPYTSVAPIDRECGERCSGNAISTATFDVQCRVEVVRGPEPPRNCVPYRADVSLPTIYWTGCYHDAVMHYAECVRELNREADWYEPKAEFATAAKAIDPDARYAPVDASYEKIEPIKPKRKYTRRVKTTTSTPAAKSAKKEKK